jgi:hypothetical protein
MNTIYYQSRTYVEQDQYVGDGADVILFNNGDCNVNINGFILPPGSSITDSCFGNENNNTIYTFAFLSGGVNPRLIIKTKYYR